MPEGDTVWRTANSLRDALEGKVLTRCDVRVPRYATVDLSGEVVDEVVSRGKHLLIRVGDHSIHTHLKMEGAWHIYAPDSRWRRPAHQARIVLATEDRVAVGFSLGITEILRRDDEESAVGHLGPDLLGPDWDAGTAIENLRAAGEQPIGLALTDQRNLAGLGNVYRNEVCFLRGVHPYTPASEVTDLPAMVTLAHRMIHADKNNSIRRRPWVYGRAGQRCRRCGTVIEGHDLGRQEIFFCTYCQPPRAD
ncbi:DNA-formamidopyrimidine glycosylase family protein [Rhodococcus sp. NCIMB 12038]|uniref:DNA-formamidopyrimidine glycosylase family protein n=1 Tax=Rhodococcus sp. NCIMB 12038 TaxID=933800 RepID=UPI000B3C1C8F|nr:DNA-formamidopyrimidine glycosylase family protein [Rhodococcus sp. NCIMB 12038]OUS94015.1 DNA glycosylase [Rhodococcus sp. NCIMB 12038]